MRRANRSQLRLERAFETCLQAMEEGQPLDSILSGFPADLAEALRPLLAAAEAARSYGSGDPPAGAAQRSRTATLVRAAELRAGGKRRSFAGLPRLATALVVLAALAIASLFSFNAASARALPGDSLYGLKLAIENTLLQAAPSESVQKNLQTVYQQRRVDEILELLRLGRSEQVVFRGVLNMREVQEESSAEQWLVSGIPVQVDANTEMNSVPNLGWLIEIEGRTLPASEFSPGDPALVLAAAIRPIEYAFTGIVVDITADFWTVGLTEIAVDALTQIDSSITIGDQVIVLVSFDLDGVPIARAILRAHSESTPGPGGPSEVTPTTSATPSPPATAVPSATYTPTASPPLPEAATTEAEFEPQEPDETDEPDETEEPTETEEPDETEEPTKTEEPSKTPEPSRTEEPDD